MTQYAELVYFAAFECVVILLFRGLGILLMSKKSFNFFSKKFGRLKKVSYLCTRNRKVSNASLAQLVEHDTLNVGVQGSSP